MNEGIPRLKTTDYRLHTEWAQFRPEQSFLFNIAENAGIELHLVIQYNFNTQEPR